MSDILEESAMTVISYNECRQTYSSIIDTQICIKNSHASACTVNSCILLV